VLLPHSRPSKSPGGRCSLDRFARVARYLRNKGTRITTNDIWIAAHAMECGADLVSFDQHFESVDGLAWVLPA
jgi:tRNA(fMet)-specific endonuclease VapC